MILGTDTRAIVTGASKGIGRAFATELDARGARLGLLARNHDDLAALAAVLGGAPTLLPADVSKRDEVESAVARFVSEAGGLDLLVANAGIAHYGPLADMDPGLAEEMVATNVLGTLVTVRAALDPMIASGRGHIVVVSSGAGLRAFPSAAVYGGTKAFGAGLASALRHELSGTGIGVTTVFPGEVATALHDHQPDRLPDWRRPDAEVEPAAVARAGLAAVEADRPDVHLPAAVRVLGLHGVAPRLVDRLLRAVRGRSAAPRRD